MNKEKSNNDRFDEMLKNKIDVDNFEFTEDAWAKFEQHEKIATKKNSKRIKGLAVLGIIASISLIGYFITTWSDVKDDSKVVIKDIHEKKKSTTSATSKNTSSDSKSVLNETSNRRSIVDSRKIISGTTVAKNSDMVSFSSSSEEDVKDAEPNYFDEAKVPTSLTEDRSDNTKNPLENGKQVNVKDEKANTISEVPPTAIASLNENKTVKNTIQNTQKATDKQYDVEKEKKNNHRVTEQNPLSQSSISNDNIYDSLSTPLNNDRNKIPTQIASLPLPAENDLIDSSVAVHADSTDLGIDTIATLPVDTLSDSIPQQKPKKVFTKSFFVASSGGIKWRDGRSSSFTNYGNQFNFIVGYSIEKFSFRLGYNYGSYKIDDADALFVPVESFWENGHAASKVNAQYQEINLPVYVSFELSNILSRSHFILNTGVNSVFLIRESYQFAYNNSNPFAIESTEGKLQNSHMLSSAHLGLEFWRNINKVVKIGGEIYGDIPLKNKGLGNIKVLTYGMNFGLYVNIPQ